MRFGDGSGISWTSGVFRGDWAMPPLWPEHKKFLNTLNQNFFLISGEGAQPSPQTPSSVGRGHPLPTLHPIGASRLWLWSPSQNPKYATELDHMQTICTSLQTDNHTQFYRPDALPDTQPTVSKLQLQLPVNFN